MSDPSKRINWADVKARLQASQLALDQVLGTSEADLDAIYRQHAAQLAARHAEARAPATDLRVLVFALGAEHYALDFADLVELLPFVNCAPVPGGPPALLGVIDVHGEVRSVVDLGRLLELPERESSVGGYVLLVRKPGGAVAWRVDQVEGIQRLDPERLAAAGEGELGAYIKGLTPDRVRLLNTEALLGHDLYRPAALVSMEKGA